MESTVPNKKVKSADIERMTMDVDDAVMTDKPQVKEIDGAPTKTPAILVPKHCNGLCE